MPCDPNSVPAAFIQAQANAYGVGPQAAERIAGRECVSYDELLDVAAEYHVNLKPYGLPYDFSGSASVATIIAGQPVAAEATATAAVAPKSLPSTGETSTLSVGGSIVLLVGVVLVAASRVRRRRPLHT